jgi:hypothetical protein
VAAIDAKWREKGADIDAVRVGLERTDVHVLELALCWIPVAA